MEGENDILGFLFEGENVRENWWGTSIFSICPPKYNLPKSERKWERKGEKKSLMCFERKFWPVKLFFSSHFCQFLFSFFVFFYYFSFIFPPFLLCVHPFFLLICFFLYIHLFSSSVLRYCVCVCMYILMKCHPYTIELNKFIQFTCSILALIFLYNWTIEF